MKEHELYTPLQLALRSLGLEVYGEVSLSYGSAIDCVALQNDIGIIGIELKVNNTKELLKQLVRTSKYCHMTFSCTPAKPNQKFLDKLKKMGVGHIYLDVDKASIKILQKPEYKEPSKELILHPYFKKQIGGVSHGNGPPRRTIYQQLCFDIEAYLKARRNVASHWKEIHEWVSGYCVGRVSRSRIKSILRISENIISRGSYAMYFKDSTMLQPHHQMKLIKEGINRRWGN